VLVAALSTCVNVAALEGSLQPVVFLLEICWRFPQRRIDHARVFVTWVSYSAE
jgi:hypothetical protein